MIPDALDTITLRLLRLFETIYRTRNISHAANALGVSQPSVSLSLNRLRQSFDDPLFVRVGARMEPTPRAEALIQAVRGMLQIANDEFVAQAPFHAPTSDRCFTIHMTDLGETILVPQLVNHFSRHAPHVRLRVRHIGEDSQTMLGDGSIDLIAGFLAKESEDLFQTKLFDEKFVCIARAGHPRIRGALTAELFREVAHVNVSATGTGHAHMERHLGPLLSDHVSTLELPGFLAIGATVAETDLIATIPSRLADQLRRQGQFQIFDLPFEGPLFQVRQYWHARFHHDAGSRWLRAVMVQLFQSPGADEAERGGPE